MKFLISQIKKSNKVRTVVNCVHAGAIAEKVAERVAEQNDAKLVAFRIATDTEKLMIERGETVGF